MEQITLHNPVSYSAVRRSPSSLITQSNWDVMWHKNDSKKYRVFFSWKQRNITLLWLMPVYFSIWKGFMVRKVTGLNVHASNILISIRLRVSVRTAARLTRKTYGAEGISTVGYGSKKKFKQRQTYFCSWIRQHLIWQKKRKSGSNNSLPTWKHLYRLFCGSVISNSCEQVAMLPCLDACAALMSLHRKHTHTHRRDQERSIYVEK